MLQCVEKIQQHAVPALVAVLLLYCTTAEPAAPANFTHTPELLTHSEEPRVLAMQRPCGPEHEGYCVNGKCSYTHDLSTPTCMCDPTFSGPRCEHVLLTTLGLSQPEEIIGITCGVLLLLGCIAVLLCFSYKRRCWRSPSLKKGQESSLQV
ncbi:epigen [Salminus brasiliensis]|uniref:epigen n=1 Tax=Salminus brasiliensis TaxID=930266 RepID=UPI003B839F88